MWDFVQVTAQYSNAVLVAILPHVSDFAKKLDLPLHAPLTAAQVYKFKCDPRKGHVGGAVILTNHFEFTFLDGRICVYRSPASYFSLQDPERISSFYGKPKVKEKEALKLAQSAIRKLGYTNSEFHADAPLEVTPPEHIGFNIVPRYRFRWLDPNWRGDKNSRVPASLDMEVNAANKRIEMIMIASALGQRAGPKVDIEPPLLKAPDESPGHSSAAPRAFWINRGYALAMLRAVLPQFSEFVTNTEISLKVPVEFDDVDLKRFSCVADEGLPNLQVYLKNGDRFNYAHGRVTAFYAHDAFFKFPETGRVEDFLGERIMSTNDAIALTKDIMHRLGYKGPPMERDPRTPVYARTDKFTRYFVNYRRSQDDFDLASFEIDLQDKKIKSVYLDDPSLWRPAPEINIPLTTQTNRPAF